MNDKPIHKTSPVAMWLEEVLVSSATFFCFKEVESAGNPDSETSPISSVSGRVPEDSSPSNWNMKTKKPQKLVCNLMGFESDPSTLDVTTISVST